MDKLLIIGGPTATGKTKLGIYLAKKFSGEIVSADSRQVYRGMDIGTGKDLHNADGVKIWLLDIVEPDYRFNVADYKKCADSVIKDIWQRGKLPIVVGGTGLYIKALVEGIETMEVSPDWELRERLSHCSVATLLNSLRKIDANKLSKMNESDRKNPRRLIRAIEIASETQNSNRKVQSQNLGIKTDNLFIGLTTSNKNLYERIDQRVEERVKEGVEEEIRGLLEKGYSWDNSALGTTLAYREWQDYFEGKKTREETIQKWKFDEHSYSRRQMTWFKKDKKVNWYDISKENYVREVEKLVKNWYIGDDA